MKFLWVLLNTQLVIILIDIDDDVGESCRCGLVFYSQQISWVPPCGVAGRSLSSPATQLGAFNWISAQIAFIIVVFMRCEGANHELDSTCLALSAFFCFDQSVIKFLAAIKVSVWAGDSTRVYVSVCECVWVTDCVRLCCLSACIMLDCLKSALSALKRLQHKVNCQFIRLTSEKFRVNCRT